MMFEKLGGRKFIGLVLLLMAGGAVDIYAPKGLSTNLMTLMLSLGSMYMVTNVAKAGVNKIKNTRRTKEIKEVKELQESVSEMKAEIKKSQDAMLEGISNQSKVLQALIQNLRGTPQ